MANPNEKRVYATWSGGIDSTAVVGQLLTRGYEVHPIVLLFGGEDYKGREAQARSTLADYFHRKYPNHFHWPTEVEAGFLSEFSADGVEIMRRNKHILDIVMMQFVIPNDVYYVAMGEYIGADTWTVKDHVGAHDADSRYLVAYLLHEYGLGYRFMALNDFGESRYKVHRVRQLCEAVGPKMAFETTNCMEETEMHCGACYKCVERAVAFQLALTRDLTEYAADPRDSELYEIYMAQMNGQLMDAKWDDVKTS